MKAYLLEIENNFGNFAKKWRAERQYADGNLQKQGNKIYFESYKKIVSLQAWRECLLQNNISADSLSFFLESQNDALVSHVLAQHGMWRSALQSLRSMIENVAFCLYYMDHRVELLLWNQGKYNPTINSFFKYLEDHPSIKDVVGNIQSVQLLKKEWEILSRAVHGSSKSFRMTLSGEIPTIFSAKQANLGSWKTRETNCILGINLLLMCVFREHMNGTKLSNLRKAVSLVVEKSKHKVIKENLNIHLYDN